MFPAALTMAPRVADLYSRATQAALDDFAWSNETNDPTAVHD
jgi:hypothetical protein